MLGEIAERMNAMRHREQIKVTPEFRADPHKHVGAAEIREGILLSEDRRVLTHWKLTGLEGMTITEYPSDAPGVQRGFYVGKFGRNPSKEAVCGKNYPLKVRYYRGPMAGAVVDMHPLGYQDAKWTCQHRRWLADCEPVPDDEPLREPLLPINFPESLKKAREVYASASGKDGSKADLATLCKHFQKLLDDAAEANRPLVVKV